MKRKGIISCLIAASVAVSNLGMLHALASITEPDIAYNEQTGFVTVSGTASQNADITLCVLENCNSWGNASKIGDGRKEELVRFFDQTKSDASGNYSFAWKIGNKGEYPIRLVDTATGEVYNGKISLAPDDITFTDLRFYSGDTRLGTLASGSITSSINADIDYGKVLNATLVSAVYDKSGKLIDVGVDEGKNLTGKSNKLTASVTVPFENNGVVLKTFLWDSLSNMMSLFETSYLSKDELETEVEDGLSSLGMFDFEEPLTVAEHNGNYYINSRSTNLFVPANSQSEVTEHIKTADRDKAIEAVNNMKIVVPKLTDSAFRCSFRVKKSSLDDLKFDFRTSAYSQGNGYASGYSQDVNLVDFNSSSKIMANGKEIANYDTDEWYEVEFKLNSDENKGYLSVIDENGNSAVTALNFNYPDVSKSAQFVAIVVKTNAPQSALVDDIKVNYYDDFEAPAHPYVLMSGDRQAEIKELNKTDATMQRYIKKILNDANSYLNQPAATYQPDANGYILTVARRVLLRTRLLGFAYAVTGETKYAQRCYNELASAATFPTWNSGDQCLCTGELLQAFAMGYDWIYDWMTEAQRETLRSAMIEKGIEPVKELYDDNVYWAFGQSNINNWNLVCNSGVGMACMAIIKDLEGKDKGLCREMMNRTRENIIEKGFTLYGPDGGWEEGTTYWNYATNGAAYYMSTLENFEGNLYGIDKMPGMAKTAYFPIAMRGSSGRAFNFSDSDIGIAPYTMNYFANLYKDANIGGWRKALIDTGYDYPHVEDALWYEPEYCADFDFYDMPIAKNYSFAGTETATLRSGWKTTDTFVGLHAGYNAASHGHLDIGTFVADFGGFRFFDDLGPDPGVGYMDFLNYNLRAEGHNTLVIGNNNKFDQRTNAAGKITAFEANGNNPYIVADITNAYTGATSIKRGIMLDNNSGAVILHDEIALSAAKDVYWFAHTSADISIAQGSKSAILTLDGKRLYVEILSDGTFESRDAAPFNSKYTGTVDNSAYKKLSVQRNMKNGTITIGMKLLEDGENNYGFTSPGALSSWRDMK